MGAATRVERSLVAMAALALLGACGDSNVTNTVTPVATTLTVNASSNAQTAMVGAALTSPISVRVADQNGGAMSNATVTWTVIGSGGTLSASTSTSDGSGNATVSWTLGNTVGVDSVRATLANLSSVILTANATAGAFNHLILVSGDAQSVAAGSMTLPMVVRAVDQFGNRVAGATVTWTTSGGGTFGTFTSASSTTDASGVAQATLTTSSTPGSYTVTASSGTATSIMFIGVGM